MNVSNPRALALARACHRILDDKKAGDIRVLDVSAQSSITDYLIIATATSEPHLRALRIELEKVIDTAQERIVGIERGQESGWEVIDAFDVMVHVFMGEVRERYGLERLWRDAAEVPASALQDKPAKKPRRAAASRPRKAPATKTKPKAKATRVPAAKRKKKSAD
ncbi:MAG: ribosome silencing factor [Opitutaceae bacterium]